MCAFDSDDYCREAKSVSRKVLTICIRNCMLPSPQLTCVIIPHACARGKVIGFVHLSLLFVIVYRHENRQIVRSRHLGFLDVPPNC